AFSNVIEPPLLRPIERRALASTVVAGHGPHIDETRVLGAVALPIVLSRKVLLVDPQEGYRAWLEVCVLLAKHPGDLVAAGVGEIVELVIKILPFAPHEEVRKRSARRLGFLKHVPLSIGSFDDIAGLSAPADLWREETPLIVHLEQREIRLLNRT